MGCLLAQAALVVTLSVRLLGIEPAVEQLGMRNGPHLVPPAPVTDELCYLYSEMRAYLQPSLAPPYDVLKVALSEKMRGLATYVLPIGIVIFLVIGVIVLGMATPSEAAASGVLGTMLLAA